MKILVGNKVDKVRSLSLNRASCSPHPHTPQEFSRQVSTTEGEQFAARMDSLFIEASAKTAVGVSEAFRDVVEKILDTPELWAPPARASTITTLKPSLSGNGMPGGMGAAEGGCSC